MNKDANTNAVANKEYKGLDGAMYTKKPEYMTSLRGMVIVPKEHAIIRLRGEIDLLQAEMLKAQHVMRRQNSLQAVDDISEVIGVLQEIMKSEVQEKPLSDIKLLGMDEQELHERSHYPKKYYGLDHFVPSLANGQAVLELNYLRARTRQVEISACEAFRDDEGKHTREDILQAFNRLSSVLYVIMFRVRTAD